MLMNRMAQVLDANLILHDGAAAVTASGAGQVASAAKILDMNANTTVSPTPGMGTAGKLDGTLLIDVSALDISSGDELYTIIVQGSPDAAFGTAANIVSLCQIELGKGTAHLQGTNADDTTGRYILGVSNWRNGTYYRYIRIYIKAAGTTPSITFTAALVPDVN